MASLIDVSALTLSPEEASDIGQLIIEQALVQGLLSETHEIQTGIHHDMRIPFAGRIADSLKASVGCTPNVGTGLVLTEKTWTPKKYDTRLTHCAADLNNLQRIFKKAQKINPDFYDRIDSEEMGLIFSLIEQMLVEVLPEKIWFSDTVAAVEPGGEFTIGTDLALHNVIDGLFKQILADAAIPAVTIAANAGATVAAQALAVDEAFDTFEKMVEIADSRLLEDPTTVILATRSMADNYRKTLRLKTRDAGFIDISENGKRILTFDGYPILVKHEWDRFIKKNLDNTVKLVLPNRALMTTPSNIPIATVAEEDLEGLDSFYDRKDKTNIVDVVFSLDAKHLEPHMSVIAK